MELAALCRLETYSNIHTYIYIYIYIHIYQSIALSLSLSLSLSLWLSLSVSVSLGLRKGHRCSGHCSMLFLCSKSFTMLLQSHYSPAAWFMLTTLPAACPVALILEEHNNLNIHNPFRMSECVLSLPSSEKKIVLEFPVHAHSWTTSI